MVEEEPPAGVVAAAGEGGDERGGHEAVHEVQLLRAGEARASGEPQREGVPRNGPGGPFHSHRTLHVPVPPTLVGDPPEPPHLSLSLARRGEGKGRRRMNVGVLVTLWMRGEEYCYTSY